MGKPKQIGKIKNNDKIFALKVKTESNGLGVLKTIIVVLLIALQAALMVASYLYFLTAFRWYLTFSIIMTFLTCIYVLSSDYHGQAKATWVLFLLVCFSFGYFIFFLSDKHILFIKSGKKFKKIEEDSRTFCKQENLEEKVPLDVLSNCNYLYNMGGFVSHTSSRTEYFSSGYKFFDNVLENLKKAKDFIFIEFFIISNGVLLNRFLDILKKKVSEGVDVRIIYDDMGSHGTLKRRTKKEIIKSGIKLHEFNRLMPVFNIALNLRDHRKIVIIDGKVAYTGGANLADEYVNEKRMHGYWKDAGIKIEGTAVDNLTLAFLKQWQFLTKTQEDYKKFLFKASAFNSDGVVVPYVSGPNYPASIAEGMCANIISNAEKFLFIATPYFIPDETITNLIINKAKSGVDVRIVLPEVADKKFVYIVSRNNAEKLLKHGVKLYTMNSSFVHTKNILTENLAIVGSANMDLRSFNQQFESAVFTTEKKTRSDILSDFDFIFAHSSEILTKNSRRRFVSYRILAGLFNLISPFM